MTSIDRHLHTGFETWQQKFHQNEACGKITTSNCCVPQFSTLSPRTFDKKYGM
jgi:hypothetical protein